MTTDEMPACLLLVVPKPRLDLPPLDIDLIYKERVELTHDLQEWADQLREALDEGYYREDTDDRLDDRCQLGWIEDELTRRDLGGL